MQWIDITEAGIANRVTAAEFAAMKTAAKSAGQTAGGILADAISVVCRFVLSHCPPMLNRGEGEKVPGESELVVLAILRNYLFSRIPNLAQQFYDKFRETEYDNAIDWLKAWAREERFVAPPDVAAPDNEQASAPRPRITPRPKNFSPCDQSGI